MEETGKRRPCKRWKYEVKEVLNIIRIKNKQVLVSDRRIGGILF
jgi:hypothetical protein